MNGSDEGRMPLPDQLPIKVSHPDKIFWPDEDYTKLDLIRFYRSVFPRLVPHMRDRMLILERCPEGIVGECFFQKEVPKSLPPGTPTTRIHHERRTVNYVVGGSIRTILALVNLGCLTFHIWNSRFRSPHQPDWICFDLDPESGKFADAAQAGQLVRQGMEALNLRSFPKTSGNSGLHVLVPIRLGPTVNEVLEFAKTFVARLAAAYPEKLTVEHARTARRGRVYLDPFRNAFAQTVVSPYSVRHALKAPVSTPLNWTEVTTTLVPADFNLGNFAKRLEAPDPWADFHRSCGSLRHGIEKLKNL
jgi:bifunctional non-homologous end joining protein LigD